LLIISRRKNNSRKSSIEQVLASRTPELDRNSQAKIMKIPCILIKAVDVVVPPENVDVKSIVRSDDNLFVP
jgi:hypothetical protein